MDVAKSGILNHLFQPLVDDTSPSHISKTSSSSVAVAPLGLSSEGKEHFGTVLTKLTLQSSDYCKILQNCGQIPQVQ